MNFSNRVFLAFLEEDNVQRAFFRLRPLLSSAGPCTQEDLSSLPDEGFLRIVPDKNEQANFKDRMRTLGNLCLVDLTPFPPEANKIRTNKNYAPDKDEKNQYILYSDTIHALQPQLFFEVVDASNAQEAYQKISSLITPDVCVRLDGKWLGPFPAGLPDLDKEMTAPQADQVFTLTLPNGCIRTFYWPVQASPVKESEMISAGEVEEEEDSQAMTANEPAVNNSVSFASSRLRLVENFSGSNASAIKSVSPLSGTPLSMAASAGSRAARPRNPLFEVVDAQWRAAKYEAPSAQLPQGAHLRHVENPLEKCREALNTALALPDAQDKVLDMLLSVPSVQQMLEKAAQRHETDGLLFAAIRRQLQEMEAERLSLLIQLDKAKENKSSYFDEAVSLAHREQTARLEKLKEEIAACQTAKEDLEKQLEVLIENRRALEDAFESFMESNGSIKLEAMQRVFPFFMTKPSLRISSMPGVSLSPDSLVTSLQETFAQEGTPLKKDDAVHFLVLFALCQKIQFSHTSLAQAARFARLCMQALGLTNSYALQSNEGQTVFLSPLVQNSSPACLVTPYLPKDALPNGARLMLLSKTPSTYLEETSYELSPWPVFMVPEPPCFMPVSKSSSAKTNPTVSLSSLQNLVPDSIELSKESLNWLQAMSSTMSEAGFSLPQDVLDMMSEYLRVAGALMQGGIAAAADYALLSWAVPHAQKHPRLRAALKSLLGPLPHSSAVLA